MGNKKKPRKGIAWHETTPKIGRGESRANQHFKWSFNKCLWDSDRWQGIISDVPLFVEIVINKLKDFETMTWAEIERASGGKREGHGNNSHFIDIVDLSKVYRHLIKQTHSDEYDKVFSLRLTGKGRLFGVVEGAVFFVLWYDNDHSTIPTSK